MSTSEDSNSAPIHDRPNIGWLYTADSLRELRRAPNGVLIFGAGKNLAPILEFLLREGILALAVCDDSPFLQGQKISGVEVLSLDDAKSRFGDQTPIIITVFYGFDKILARLLQEGFRTLYCGLNEAQTKSPETTGIESPQGPFWPLPEAEPTSVKKVLVVLPPGAASIAFLERKLLHIRRSFPEAEAFALAAAAADLPHYRQLLVGETVSVYDRNRMLSDFSASVFVISNEEGETTTNMPPRQLLERKSHLFTDDPREIFLIPAYIVGYHGDLTCINRAISSRRRPELQRNPFLQLSSRDPAEHLCFFPFGALYRDSTMGPTNEFGFRISEDLHALGHRKPQHKVVAVFGGSTAYSILCYPHEMWTQRLEDKLNRFSRDVSSEISYSVLNFGQPSATIVNSMVYYLFFCHRLQPDYVIAHEVCNFLGHGISSAPTLLNHYDLPVQDFFEEWSRQLFARREPVARSANRPQAIALAFHRRLDQFRRLIQADGGRFLWGLQPTIQHKPALSHSEFKFLDTHYGEQGRKWPEIDFAYQVLEDSLGPKDDFVDFRPLLSNLDSDFTFFGDYAHTTPEGDELIAQTYFDYLETHLENDHAASSLA